MFPICTNWIPHEYTNYFLKFKNDQFPPPAHFLSFKFLISFLLYDTCIHFVFYIISSVVVDTDMGRCHSIQIQKKKTTTNSSVWLSVIPIRFLIEKFNEQWTNQHLQCYFIKMLPYFRKQKRVFYFLKLNKIYLHVELEFIMYNLYFDLFYAITFLGSRCCFLWCWLVPWIRWMFTPGSREGEKWESRAPSGTVCLMPYSPLCHSKWSINCLYVSREYEKCLQDLV